jgi:hypothetical protein
MELTTREDVIKAGHAAIKSGGYREDMQKFERYVEQYGEQQNPVDYNRLFEIHLWYKSLDVKNFSTMTIEKFNASLSNLP